MPVAFEIAKSLRAPLDVFLVGKLGVPGQDELAMGAVASGGVVVLNGDVVRGLSIGPTQLQQVAECEARELLRREQVYRGNRPPFDLEGLTVVLVDDGLATGGQHAGRRPCVAPAPAGRIVVAIPAAPESTCREPSGEVDEVVCATTPSRFVGVGASYWDFTQTTDEEVLDLLRRVGRSVPPPGPKLSTAARVIRAEAQPLVDAVPSPAQLDELVGDARIR